MTGFALACWLFGLFVLVIGITILCTTRQIKTPHEEELKTPHIDEVDFTKSHTHAQTSNQLKEIHGRSIRNKKRSSKVLPWSKEHDDAHQATYTYQIAQANEISNAPLLMKGLSDRTIDQKHNPKQPNHNHNHNPNPNHDHTNHYARSVCDAPITSLPPSKFFRPTVTRRVFIGIGINYLSKPEQRLLSCWNDIDSLYETFSTRHGPFTKTWLLMDKPNPINSTSASTSASTSPSNITHLPPILSSLVQIFKELTTDYCLTEPTDIVFVYSGHGTFRTTKDPNELTGQSDAIRLLDVDFYDYDILATCIRPLGPHVRMLMVLDSCNSGSAANLPWTFNTLSQTVNQSSLHTDLRADVMLISGCRDEQTSAAGPTDHDPSECTRMLLASFKEKPLWEACQLLQHLRHKLWSENDAQIPQLSVSKPVLISCLI